MQLTAAGRSGRFSKMHGTLRTTMPLRDSIRKIDVKHSDGNNLNRGVKYSEYDAFFRQRCWLSWKRYERGAILRRRVILDDLE